MIEMYGVDYPEVVEDRDGEPMPFNREVIGVGTQTDNPADWKHHFCICGHLVIDHHVDADYMTTKRMYCWAKECPCYLLIGSVIQPVFQHHNPQN